MSRIFDCTIVGNEADMLRFRLCYYANVVTDFVVVEASHTHRGEFRGFSPQVEAVVKEFSDKLNIRHVRVDLGPYVDKIETNSPEAHKSNSKKYWLLENMHRNSILHGLRQEGAAECDIAIVSDVDEFVHKSTIDDYVALNLQMTMAPIQRFCYYTADNVSVGRKDTYWKGSVISRYNDRFNPQELRENRWMLFSPHNTRLGWHWSYFGGEEYIKQKLNNIVDAQSVMQEFNLTPEKCLENYRNGQDLYGRPGMLFKKEQLGKLYGTDVLGLLHSEPWNKTFI